MEVKVLNISGKETGAKVQLPEAIFGVEPNDHAIYLDVKHIGKSTPGNTQSKTA